MADLTLAQARRLGYDLTRGAYVGTCDDRLAGWYVDRQGQPRDRRGPGYATRAEALQALAELLASQGVLP